jgi:hypothetical protein
MEKPKNKNSRQITHVGMASNSTEPLLGTPNTIDKTGKIKREIEFGVKSIPTS